VIDDRELLITIMAREEAHRHQCSLATATRQIRALGLCRALAPFCHNCCIPSIFATLRKPCHLGVRKFPHHLLLSPFLPLRKIAAYGE